MRCATLQLSTDDSQDDATVTAKKMTTRPCGLKLQGAGRAAEEPAMEMAVTVAGSRLGGARSPQSAARSSSSEGEEDGSTAAATTNPTTGVRSTQLETKSQIHHLAGDGRIERQREDGCGEDGGEQLLATGGRETDIFFYSPCPLYYFRGRWLREGGRIQRERERERFFSLPLLWFIRSGFYFSFSLPRLICFRIFMSLLSILSALLQFFYFLFITSSI